MSDWTAGYVSDIGYTFGYYNELNPLRVRLAFLDAGLALPDGASACELGFGQGMSVNLHAAASTTKWYGTDFNPAQAAFAQELALASMSGAQLSDAAFADFTQRSDLPDFDFIGLHGIWSWISDPNRLAIVDFVRRKLKVGGVLYISYNTQPGWAATQPLRELLWEHAQVQTAKGSGTVARVDAALAFADQLLQANAGYFRANPQMAERLKKMATQNRHYLAHEYFNRDWQPMPFSRMAEWLGSAKLEYACSANYIEHVDPINLSGPQQALLKGIADPVFRETVRDFCVNQQFRKDYWVKGTRRLNAVELKQARLAQRVVLVQPRAQVSLKVAGAAGEASMHPGVYTPIVELMADHQPRSVAEIVQAVGPSATAAQVWQAVLVLTGAGSMSPVQDDTVAAQARRRCSTLNEHLVAKALGRDDLAYLASPVTGGGVMVGRFQQLFLHAISQGKTQPEEWVAHAWACLQQQGQRLIKDGKPLLLEQENLAALLAQAQDLASKGLPILRALQVVHGADMLNGAGGE